MTTDSNTKMKKLIGVSAALTTVLGATTLAYLLNPEKFEKGVQNVQDKVANSIDSLKKKFKKSDK